MGARLFLLAFVSCCCTAKIFRGAEDEDNIYGLGDIHENVLRSDSEDDGKAVLGEEDYVTDDLSFLTSDDGSWLSKKIAALEDIALTALVSPEERTFVLGVVLIRILKRNMGLVKNKTKNEIERAFVIYLGVLFCNSCLDLR